MKHPGYAFKTSDISFRGWVGDGKKQDTDAHDGDLDELDEEVEHEVQRDVDAAAVGSPSYSRRNQEAHCSGTTSHWYQVGTREESKALTKEKREALKQSVDEEKVRWYTET
jgi:hypothetical protein